MSRSEKADSCCAAPPNESQSSALEPADSKKPQLQLHLSRNNNPELRLSGKDLPQFLVNACMNLENGNIEQSKAMLTDENIKIVREIVKNNPSNANIMLVLAHLLHQTGQLSKAKEWYIKTLEQDPCFFVRNQLIDVYTRSCWKISFIVDPGLQVSRDVRNIIELSNCLAKRGHSVTVYHSGNISNYEWRECVAKVKPYNELFCESHDVVICSNANRQACEFAEKSNTKVVIYYICELCPAKHAGMPALRENLQSPCLKLSNSTSVKTWLKEDICVHSPLLIGGVNFEVFHPVPVPKNPGEIRILYSPNEEDTDATETIFKAIEIAKKEKPQIILDTFYDGKISEHEMAKKYCSADIFIAPASHTGWNNSVAEAMACKVSVICADTGGVADFAFHERTALLVPAKNPQAMAAAIVRVVVDEKLKEALRNNAYNYIKQFDWKKTVKRLESFLAKELFASECLASEFVKNNLYPEKSKVIRGFAKIVQDSLRKPVPVSGSFDKYKELGPYHWILYKNNHEYRSRVDFITGEFEKRNKGALLDVGCGDGLISCILAQRGFNVKGIDREDSGIKLAQKLCQIANFEIKDVFDSTEQCDYILASEIIEHIPDVDGFLQKIAKLFKKEALITTPIKNYYTEPDRYHLREYNYYEFENLLQKYFTVSQIHCPVNYETMYAWVEHK